MFRSSREVQPLQRCAAAQNGSTADYTAGAIDSTVHDGSARAPHARNVLIILILVPSAAFWRCGGVCGFCFLLVLATPTYAAHGPPSDFPSL